LRPRCWRNSASAWATMSPGWPVNFGAIWGASRSASVSPPVFSKRGQQVLGGWQLAAAFGELDERPVAPGIADVLAEVLEILAELGPELGRPVRFVGADDRQVAADAAAELEGRTQPLVDVGRDVVALLGDALDGPHVLPNGDAPQHAGGAQRPRVKRGKPPELAGHAVAPAPRHARLVVTRERAVLFAEDAGLLAGEVIPVDDELVGLVDLGQLAAAAPPEDHVHHDRGAGHSLPALRIVAGEAKRREQVMAQEQLLAQAPAHVPAEEPRGDEEHADAAGHEQIERPPHEVGVGALLLVECVRIFAGHDASLAVGRVRGDEVQRAAVARTLLADPALEGHVIELDVRPKRAKDRRADYGILDRGPFDLLDLTAGLELEAKLRAERPEKTADAGARLERPNDAVAARELGEHGADGGDKRPRDHRRREVLVDEPERLGHEALGDLLLDGLDREAAPPGVCGQHRELLRRELARLLHQHELHRLQVRLGAPRLRLQVGRGLKLWRYRGGDRAAHPRPEGRGVALEPGFWNVAGHFEELLVAPKEGHPQAILLRVARHDGHLALDLVDDGDDLAVDEDGRRRLAQEQRDRVQRGTPQQDRRGARLDVAPNGDVGRDALPGLPLHQACGEPLQDDVVGLGVPRPLALGELAVGRELLGGLGWGALLDPPVHHRPFDDDLERRTVARDEPVDEVDRVARGQLGSPARQ
jgi:hypothetical protein